MKSLDTYKILVVDDHMLSRKLLTVQLVNYGFIEENITARSNAKEALQEFENGAFDIVIADWDMPETNGLEFVQECKKIEKNKTAYVMISAEAQSDRILYAVNHGVTCYITKPVSQIDIDEKMVKVVNWMEDNNN